MNEEEQRLSELQDGDIYDPDFTRLPHILSLIDTGCAKVIPEVESKRMVSTLNSLTWYGSYLDWNQLEPFKELSRPATWTADAEMRYLISQTGFARHLFAIALFPGKPSLGGPREFILSHLDTICYHMVFPVWIFAANNVDERITPELSVFMELRKPDHSFVRL